MHVILLFCLAWLAWPAADACAGGPAQSRQEARQNTSAAERLAAIERERQRLLAIRKGLEAQLGALGRRMRELDRRLIEARKAREAVDREVRALDAGLRRLNDRKQAIERDMRRLREALLREAEAAWRNGLLSGAGRLDLALWLDALESGEVARAPHRRWLLARVMAAQAQDRRRLRDLRAELTEVEREMRKRRGELAEARERQRAIERELARKLAAKRELARKLKAEIRGHRRKETALAREREALKRLLEGLDDELMALDRRIQEISVRRRKGRLRWPLKGRITASFHSRAPHARARLNGVRLAPVGADRRVRAMAAGQVRYADWFGGYGLMMIVDYGDGVLGVYAHNDALFKQIGDWVEEGEVIARAGSTGLVDRTRLYFEIRDHGRPVNPRRWCRR